MLSTPPAFVLSQDQTLKKLYLNDLSRSNHVFWSICLANLLKNFRWLFFKSQTNLIFVQGDKSHLYVIQFTRYSSVSLAVARRRLAYISTHSPICQHLFSYFFWIYILHNNSNKTRILLGEMCVFYRLIFQFHIHGTGKDAHEQWCPLYIFLFLPAKKAAP